jgi:hypothetical protein
LKFRRSVQKDRYPLFALPGLRNGSERKQNERGIGGEGAFGGTDKVEAGADPAFVV